MSSLRDKFRHQHDELVRNVLSDIERLAEVVASLLFSAVTTSTIDV